MNRLVLVLLLFFSAALVAQQSPSSKSLSAVAPVEGDYVLHNVTFADGQSLPEVKMHYMTMGTPQRDARGQVTNAVVVLHGTNRAGRVFMIPGFAGELFGSGQLLDTSRYYVIIPDQFGAGMGKSTKPREGLHARFPHYDYADMIRINQQLLEDGLKVNHLRLLVGASMGCMQGFMWGESNPNYIDAMLLLSCLPVPIGGRNRMVRKIMIDDVKKDPGWKNGDYTEQPYGLRAAIGHLLVVGSTPTLWQAEYPTAETADPYVDRYIEQAFKTTDANDFIYQYDASRNYNPNPELAKITAHVMQVNVYDDFWNPGEMGVAEREIKKVKNGKFVLLPVTDKTRGHYTFFVASAWKNYLEELLKESQK